MTKPKFENKKIYISEHGKLFMVDEKKNAFVIYHLIPVYIINKIKDKTDDVIAKPPEESIETYLRYMCKVELDQ